MAARCYVLRKNYGWATDDAAESAEITRLAWRAARLGEQDAIALYTAGFALTRVVGYLEDGAALIDRALSLDPNLAAAWRLSGWMQIYLAEPDRAIEHLARAMRLNPLDPLIFGVQNGTAAAYFLASRYSEASSWAEAALRQHAGYAPAMRMAAASHALGGRLPDAQKFMARMREVEPEFRVGNIAEVAPFRRPEDVARYEEGLRKAGLPE
jgi:tetratricopeptide (TPR) repeat protein